MSTLREQILARVTMVLTALGAAATPTFNVARSRTIAIQAREAPYVLIRPASSAPQRLGDHALRHQFAFDVKVHVHHIQVDPGTDAVADDTPWDAQADSIDLAVHAALRTDPTLSTLAAITRTAEVFEDSDANGTLGVLTVTYQATFLTRAEALDQPPR